MGVGITDRYKWNIDPSRCLIQSDSIVHVYVYYSIVHVAFESFIWTYLNTMNTMIIVDNGMLQTNSTKIHFQRLKGKVTKKKRRDAPIPRIITR